MFILNATHHRKVYICILAVSWMIIIWKVMMCYYEVNHKVHGIKFFCKLQQATTFYRLNKNNHDRFILVANILFSSFRLGGLLIFNTLALMLLLPVLYFYFFVESESNIIIMIISFVHAYICYKHLFLMITGGVSVIFIMIFFLKWKLDEIIKTIRLSMLWSVDCEPFNKSKTRLSICLTHGMSYTKKWSGSIKGCR